MYVCVGERLGVEGGFKMCYMYVHFILFLDVKHFVQAFMLGMCCINKV